MSREEAYEKRSAGFCSANTLGIPALSSEQGVFSKAMLVSNLIGGGVAKPTEEIQVSISEVQAKSEEATKRSEKLAQVGWQHWAEDSVSNGAGKTHASLKKGRAS